MSVGASGATPVAATFTKWYCPDCVFPRTCSKPGWKRAKVNSWVSDEDCRSALLRHLVESSLHTDDKAHHGEEGLRWLVWRANVERRVFTAEEIPSARSVCHVRLLGGATSARRSLPLREVLPQQPPWCPSPVEFDAWKEQPSGEDVEVANAI